MMEIEGEIKSEIKGENKSEIKGEGAHVATLDIELSVKEIMGEVDEIALQPAIAFLLKIIRNVLTSDDPKFRSINLSRQIFQEKIGRFGSCLRFLTVVGFNHDKQTMTSKLLSENRERLEHASLLLEEALFSLEKAAPTTEDTARIEPDYDLSQVRVILGQLNKQIAESVGADGINSQTVDYERKLKTTLDTLLLITSNLLLPGSDPVYRTLEAGQFEFFVQGWSMALDYLGFLGFVQDQDKLRLQNEHPTKISRACSVLKRYIEESTPTEEQILRREALRSPPERQVQFFLPTAVVNPQLTGDYDRADAGLLMQAAAAHQKKMKEQFPDVIITRQQRALEKAKTKRKYDRTLVRVFFNSPSPESQVIVQAYFHPYETLEALFAFIQTLLCTPHKSFYFLNPPDTIEAPPTIVFDKSLDLPPPPSSSSSSLATNNNATTPTSSGTARHLGSRLLGTKPRDAKKSNNNSSSNSSTMTFHLNSNTNKPIPTFHDLKLVPAAALHFHWSDGSAIGTALLGECYQHRRPLELPNIPRAINFPQDAHPQQQQQEGKDKAAAAQKEDAKAKKWRLKEEALKRKMGF